MTALGEGHIGVLSDGGSIPLTSTIQKDQGIIDDILILLFIFPLKGF